MKQEAFISSGWWWLEHEWIMICHSVGNNNPNWRIFFRGVQTTNQSWLICCFRLLFYIHGHFFWLPGELLAEWSPSISQTPNLVLCWRDTNSPSESLLYGSQIAVWQPNLTWKPNMKNYCTIGSHLPYIKPHIAILHFLHEFLRCFLATAMFDYQDGYPLVICHILLCIITICGNCKSS